MHLYRQHLLTRRSTRTLTRRSTRNPTRCKSNYQIITSPYYFIIIFICQTK